MAIYHLRLKVLSRSLGRAARPGGATRRSAVAAAAYRSGQELYDEAQSKSFRFDKPDVIHSEILAPDNQDVPAWVFDRQQLWNRVEAAEKREDAQLMREVEITLPRELSKDQQVALVRAFVRDNFVSLGMVADIAIHCPKAADGQAQPHAHVSLALRRLEPGSANGFSPKKERDWNEREDIARAVAQARKTFNNTGLEEDREALEAAEAKRNVNVWRKAWQDYANAALEEAGSTARIDARTLEKQGIFRMPQIDFGIARHLAERAYTHIKSKVTHWVAICQRGKFYDEAERLRKQDPDQLGQMMVTMLDMAERFAAQFRKPPDDREVPHER